MWKRWAKMDLNCFFKTITSVLKSNGVVEGGTGITEKNYKSIRGIRKDIFSSKEA